MSRINTNIASLAGDEDPRRNQNDLTTPFNASPAA